MTGCFITSDHATISAKPKYIFLFIGDGLGENHRLLAELTLKQLSPPATLCMNTFPVQAKTFTLNSSGQVADSAAAGTAIACGVKTVNGRLGMDLGENHVTSIAVTAKEKGMKVGIISSTAINDATPASFYAHVKARGQYSDIVKDMASSKFNFFGGGKLLCDKTAQNDIEAQLIVGGYKILNGKNGLNAATTENCFAQCVNSYTIDSNAETDKPTLADYTAKGIELLKNPNGFFMMIEGGKIDHASHSNDTGTMLKELYEFDSAIKVAREFQQRHPNDTLLVVTSDHETGGLEFDNKQQFEQKQLTLFLNQKCSAAIIASELKKIDKASATYEQSLNIIINLTGFNQFSTSDENKLKVLWHSNSADKLKQFTTQALMARDRHLGVKWNLTGHSGTPVLTSVSAQGEVQELFAGTYENSAIFTKLKSLLDK